MLHFQPSIKLLNPPYKTRGLLAHTYFLVRTHQSELHLEIKLQKEKQIKASDMLYVYMCVWPLDVITIYILLNSKKKKKNYKLTIVCTCFYFLLVCSSVHMHGYWWWSKKFDRLQFVHNVVQDQKGRSNARRSSNVKSPGRPPNT